MPTVRDVGTGALRRPGSAPRLRLNAASSRCYTTCRTRTAHTLYSGVLAMGSNAALNASAQEGAAGAELVAQAQVSFGRTQVQR